jgi:hypothetical protein
MHILKGFESRKNQTLIKRPSYLIWESIRFKAFSEKRGRRTLPARTMNGKAAIYLIRPIDQELTSKIFAELAKLFHGNQHPTE